MRIYQLGFKGNVLNRWRCILVLMVRYVPYLIHGLKNLALIKWLLHRLLFTCLIHCMRLMAFYDMIVEPVQAIVITAKNNSRPPNFYLWHDCVVVLWTLLDTSMAYKLLHSDVYSKVAEMCINEWYTRHMVYFKSSNRSCVLCIEIAQRNPTRPMC